MEVIILIVIGIFAIIFGGDEYKKTPPSRPGLRCPNCGAQISVTGRYWECGYCGDCGEMKVD